MEWFTAHKDGLRQIAERLVDRRGFGIIAGELYQNCMDTAATSCSIQIEKLAGRPVANIIVTDNNPTGFNNLSDAWTVFAPSEKKGDPTKAGRFNLGEKMVLAFCHRAEICTTKGTIIFDGSGRNLYPRRKRESGTVFSAEIACTQERYEQFLDYVKKVIVRPGLQLTINGAVVAQRKPIHSFYETLATEIGDDLRKTSRRCLVEVYEPLPGEPAALYELGIPIVETGDKWDISVSQKIPLNVDRDNVTPAFLRTLRTFVVNHMANHLVEADVNTTMVREATSDDRISAEAMKKALDLRFGEKRVAFDPSDPEANRTAVANGFTVVSGSMMNKNEWENTRKTGTTTGAGNMFPSPKPYSPNGSPAEYIPEDEWTPGMKKVVAYARFLHKEIIGQYLNVRILRGTQVLGDNTVACYGSCCLDFCLKRLGHKFFDNFGEGVYLYVDELLIHEFGHYFSSNHLDHEYYDGLCQIGARYAQLCMEQPNRIQELRK